MISVKKAVILAGGEGTRLRPLTLSTPKALLDVNGKTLTEHLFDILKRSGITEVVLSVCYLADKVKDYFKDGSRFGMRISYIEEKTPMGTAAPFILMKKTDEPMIVMNGDNLFDVDFEEMEKQHIKNKALATIALTKVDDISRFGSVEFDEDGKRILAFKEKQDKRIPGWISSGYYIMEPAVFDVVKGKKHAMLETDVFPVFAEQEKLYGFKDNGLWFDTGTFESYERVKKEWKLSK